MSMNARECSLWWKRRSAILRPSDRVWNPLRTATQREAKVQFAVPYRAQTRAQLATPGGILTPVAGSAPEGIQFLHIGGRALLEPSSFE
eukprot:CAMPEP_0195060578 /NCGR_PEP_ID=MMETSP0448-20130528/7812_1 /TAXON_ID=66468 /ORGANISM="Heterocapsa triquestra, Strain CCMP 448" /LENGTH=88 /DNA_ID=CAMNT_0040091019 /DNA_START=60 /DNA_END=323 /DNA_ORIENTATION=+